MTKGDLEIVFLYSGQGSQYYNMSKDLYDSNSTFRHWMQKLDYIAEVHCGKSILSIMFDDLKSNLHTFDRLLYTNPAIFMVEYSLTQTLIEIGIKPDYIIGASLGEYVSLAVAGNCSYEDILKFVIDLAQALENEYNGDGAMLAVLANKKVLQSGNLLSNCEIAAHNQENHFILSGKAKHILDAEKYLKTNNYISQLLPVSYAFHSSFIDELEDLFKKKFKKILFRQSDLKIISCANKGIPNLDVNYLWDVVRKPIHFEDVISFSEKSSKCVYIDLGPGGTLANLINNKKVESKAFSIVTPYGGSMEKITNITNYISSFKNLANNLSNINININMNVYVFPGQGSQKKGMGKELFDEFEDLTKKADHILGYSIKDLCVNNSENLLFQTQYAQVALYVVNAFSYLKKIQDDKIPDYVIGHSLGEYNALFAAGAFDFSTGLKLVQRRGQIMSKAFNGGMAAIKGLSIDTIKKVLSENKLQTIDIANLNTHSQTVISGPKQDILDAQVIFEKAGAQLYFPLNVSGAFHSRYMKEGLEEFSEFLKNFKFDELKINVIANVSGTPYINNSEHISKTLEMQLISPVKWNESIEFLIKKGITNFCEVGDSEVLTKIIKEIKSEFLPNSNSIHDDSSQVMQKKENTLPFKDPKSGNYNDLINNKLTLNKDFECTQEGLKAEDLGSRDYRKRYNLKYSYAAGGMYKGVSSSKLVIALSKAGMMSYFGSGGLSLGKIEEEIIFIKSELDSSASFGINIVYNLFDSTNEDRTIDLCLNYNINNIEAAAYMQLTSSLVKYRLKGLRKGENGEIIAENNIQAKISRPEVAELFLKPAPEKIVRALFEANEINEEQMELSKFVSVASEICVEADSGGHTDQGVMAVLLPSIVELRRTVYEKYTYSHIINIGAAGGIGTPEAAATAFMLGADYIVTGSINQCTVEAGTSNSVKNLLESINVQDTAYAPAGDMFELGSKVQVLKKGVFFPARANKLLEIYKQYDSLESIDEKLLDQLEKKYFNKSIKDIYDDCKVYYNAKEIAKAEINQKYKMAMIFKWYFGFSSKVALLGDESNLVNYQVHCGPALGAFNQWVKGTTLERWEDRKVAHIGFTLMEKTAEYLTKFLHKYEKIILIKDNAAMSN